MTSRQTRKLADILVVAASLGVLLSVAYDSVPRLLHGHNDNVGVKVVGRVSVPSRSEGNARENINRIIAAHLFGRAHEEKQTARNVPETKLRLRLMGTIASADRRYARALIEVNTHQVSSYKPGDGVKGTDAKVKAVEPKRVLLDRHGAVESLDLRLPVVSLHGTLPARSSGISVSPAPGQRASRIGTTESN